MEPDASSIAPLGPEDELHPGERTGPGFEGIACPSCGKAYRVRIDDFPGSLRCPCGTLFGPDELECPAMEQDTLLSAGPVTMMVLDGAEPEPREADPPTILEASSEDAPTLEGVRVEPADPGMDAFEASLGEGDDPGEFETLAPERPPTYVEGQKASSEAEKVTTRFGRYRIIEEIARGGMGVVYRARQEGLDREVALKMLLAGDGASDEQIRRFLREAGSAGKLSHPGIVPIYDVGEEEGKHYYAMEFIRGESVAQILARMKMLPPRQALKIARETALALQYAHENDILHRDIKPANIMLAPQESQSSVEVKAGESVIFKSGVSSAFRVVVTDFGLAKEMGGDSVLTLSGTALGTPVYMPPEQAEGELDKMGPPSDVYSLGAVLYEMVTGHEPFQGATVGQLLARVVSEDPIPPRKHLPGLHRDLETIILTAMAKEPGRRYASAKALADDVERYLKGEAISARPASFLYRASKFIRRHRALSMAVLLVAAVLVAAVIRDRNEARRLRAEEAARLILQIDRARDALAKGDLIEAERSFESALALDPSLHAVRAAMRQTRLERILINTREALSEENWKAAGKFLQDARLLAPDDPEVARLERLQKGTATLEVRGPLEGCTAWLAPADSAFGLFPDLNLGLDDLRKTGVLEELGPLPVPPTDRAFGDAILVVARGDALENVMHVAIPRSADLAFEHRVVHVRSDGQGDFATVAEAVKKAMPGWIIEIHEGRYPAKLNVRAAGITLRAAKGENVLLGPLENGPVIKGQECGGLRVQGLEIRAEKGPLVEVSRAPGTVLTDNLFVGGTALAVQIDNSDYVIVAGNEISGCKEAGMKLHFCNSGVVTGNHVHHCGWAGIIVSSNSIFVARNHVHECTRAGIFVNESKHVEVSENLVHHLPEWGILLVERSYKCLVTNNAVWDVHKTAAGQYGTGILLGKTNSSRATHNTVYRCDLGVQIRHSPRSPVTDNIILDATVLGMHWHDGDEVDYNCLWQCHRLAQWIEKPVNSLAQWREVYKWRSPWMANGMVADPKMKAPEKGDFTLSPDSPCKGKASDGRDIGADGAKLNLVRLENYDKTAYLQLLAARFVSGNASAAWKRGDRRHALVMLKVCGLLQPRSRDIREKIAKWEKALASQ